MRDKLLRRLLAISILLAGPAVAEPISLFRDLETAVSNRGSNPRDFLILDGMAYFFASDDPHGRELWRSDGTAAGTRLVADICPGPCDSHFLEMVSAGGRLFFAATDGVSGHELWTSDGTAAGTALVADICPGSCSGWVSELAAAGERVFFSGFDDATGLEPWVSDGTPEGTRRLGDLFPGQEHSFPDGWLAFEGRVFFKASTPETGTELWVSNGTPEGTRLVADICPGECSSLPRLLTVFRDRLFLQIETPQHGAELWTSDGTPEGTALFTELVPGSGGTNLDTVFEHGGLLYLAGFSFAAPVCGERFRCVWRTDGTPQGTVVAHELFPYLSPQSGPALMLPAGALLYWSQPFQNHVAIELWVYDGIERRRLLEGDGYLEPFLGLPDGRLIFGVYGASPQLWVSDGTVAGTRPIPGVEPTTDHFSSEVRGVLFDDEVLFAASLGSGNLEPWLSDGTVVGTSLLHELHPPRSASHPRDLFAFDDRLLFAAGSAPESGLWVSDGTAAGTERVAEGAAGAAWARLGERVLVSDFQGTGKLWTSDGSAAGTTEIPGVEDAGDELVRFGEAVYFSAGFEGEQLWRSDGTAAGTRLVKDLNPDFHIDGPPVIPPLSFSLPQSLTVASSSLYMVAFESTSESELWKSDGTAEGTVRLERFDNEPTASDFLLSGPKELTALGGGLLFSGFSIAAGRELWASDGTPAGTRQLADVAAGAASSAPSHFTVLGGRVFFTARQVDGRGELWASDGTPAGTARLAAFSPPGELSMATEMIAAGGNLFLSVWTLSAGAELWVSDGTLAGTRLLVDLFPGHLGSGPSEFLALGDDRVLFVASDPARGRELWVSDGTVEGTLLVEDLAPGTDASGPGELTLLGDMVVFAADDTVHGRELFAVKLADLPTAPPPPDPCPADRLCLHDGRFEVEVAWRDFQGNDGPGHVVPNVASSDSGLFWFFDAANYEFLVKVLRGCDVNGHYWVLAAATTNVEYTLTVTDTTTGIQAIYTNALGRSSPAIIDVEAFDDCP